MKELWPHKARTNPQCFLLLCPPALGLGCGHSYGRYVNSRYLNSILTPYTKVNSNESQT